MQHLTGFGNHHSSEAVSGALPQGQNSPQKAPFGLYAEQISGSAFTAPRHENFKTWAYRLLPSVSHGGYRRLSTHPNHHGLGHQFFEGATPEQLRWDPLTIPKTPTDFVQGIQTYAVTHGAALGSGVAAHGYVANESMKGFFYNADAELLIVPQEGSLTLRTELGELKIEPQEIGVIPRGIKFQVKLDGPKARGYLAENFGAALRLPELGPIGANGLAHARDFQAPIAAFEDKKGPFEVICKFQGQLWVQELSHSPLDVVAWHGNLYPYKYDLRKFNTIGTVSYDHPDPSISTVLTSPSGTPGVANLDFVIFPPRWMVAEHTFRPPYFHRNCMSEFMGLIHGAYDAKEDGFVPGGASLHNVMSAHGPDAQTFEKASTMPLSAQKIESTMAFMFESRHAFLPTQWALKSPHLQSRYLDCWKNMPRAQVPGLSV